VVIHGTSFSLLILKVSELFSSDLHFQFMVYVWVFSLGVRKGLAFRVYVQNFTCDV